MKKIPEIHDADACPIAKTAALIGDLWTLLIVKELLSGPKRFNELEKLINNTDPIGDISSRTLSQRLKKLEAEKIITRKVYQEIPPHSEYTLTQKGQALSEIIEKMREYGQVLG